MGEGRFALQLVQDEIGRCGAVLTYNGRLVARSNGGGEFSVTVTNSDRSFEKTIRDWKAEAWTGDAGSMTLTGAVEIAECGGRLAAEVRYEVVNPSVVRKRISLTQTVGPKLLYRLENRLEPIGRPDSFWTFEQDHSEGGTPYEVFPAAGFRVHGIAFGLLTDSGVKNHWTRLVRRRNTSKRTKRTYEGIDIQPDTELVKVADERERADGHNYVAMTFGGLKDFTRGHVKPYPTPDVSEQTIDDCSLIAIRVRQGHRYTVSFLYRSPTRPTIRLLNEDHSRELNPYENPPFPPSPSEWKKYTQAFFIHGLTGPEDTAHLVVSGCGLDIKDLTITETIPMDDCYHPLELGKTDTKTFVIFAEEGKTRRDVQLACQTRLAEGLGFDGTSVQKVLYSTARMLTWISEPNDFTAHVVPSMNYQPDMYLRDAFWITASMYDQFTAESVWNKYASTQSEEGQIMTLFTPYCLASTYEENESNMIFILMAYVNKTRYGTEVDTEIVQRALDYIQKTFARNGVYRSKTAGWFDIIWWDKKVVFAADQGLYPSVLRAARSLGCEVTELEIHSAEEAYRSLYDPDLGYVVFGDQMRDVMSPGVLIGEFVSLWLWDHQILSDEAVRNTLDKLPVLKNRIMPIIIGNDGRWVTELGYDVTRKWEWKGGVYGNGGGWLLYEYLAYVAGLKHGWGPARERMALRLEAELSARDAPVSHEWIPLTDDDSDWWPIVRVFGWNSFVIIADEIAQSFPSDEAAGR